MEIQNIGNIGGIRTSGAYTDMLRQTDVNVSMSVHAKSSVAVTVSSATGQLGVGVGVPRENVLKVAVGASAIEEEQEQGLVQMSVEDASQLERLVSERRFEENPSIQA